MEEQIIVNEDIEDEKMIDNIDLVYELDHEIKGESKVTIEIRIKDMIDDNEEADNPNVRVIIQKDRAGD